MAIILNDGLRLPTTRIEELRFSEGTPYEKWLAREPPAAVRVLDAAVGPVAARTTRSCSPMARRLWSGGKPAPATTVSKCSAHLPVRVDQRFAIGRRPSCSLSVIGSTARSPRTCRARQPGSTASRVPSRSNCLHSLCPSCARYSNDQAIPVVRARGRFSKPLTGLVKAVRSLARRSSAD